jgi:hydrogenase nickel incorporation protein HypA/HybF
MHEFAVTQNLLAVALEGAQSNNARRITAIHIRVGSLTGIVEESVRFCFDVLSLNTIAQGATITFAHEFALATCTECTLQWQVSLPLLPECPRCASGRVTVTGGKDLVVESIEVTESIESTPVQ